MQLLNYLAEIVAFEKWTLENPIPRDSQYMWYKLMSTNNRCGWAEWFQVDNSRLMALVGVSSEKTLISIRKHLIDYGLIEYQKGKKGSPSKYRMVSINCKFYSKKQDTPAEPPEVAPDTKIPEGIESEDVSGYLGAINHYFGMNDDRKAEVAAFTNSVYDRFVGRPPTQQEITNMFYRVYENSPGPDGRWEMRFPEEKKQLAEYAFDQAAEAGKVNWKYINGIYRNFAMRGIKTVDEAERYEAERANI